MDSSGLSRPVAGVKMRIPDGSLFARFNGFNLAGFLNAN